MAAVEPVRWERLLGITLAASGVPGFESVSIVGMFVPARTAAAAVNRLSQDIPPILASAEVKEKLLGAGVEALSSTPEQLAATVKSDIALVARLVKEGGLKIE